MRAPAHGITRLAALVLLACAAPVRAEPAPEPPAAADPVADYAAEPDDSTDTGSVAVGYGFAGRAGGAATRTRSLLVRGDSVEAGVRDGDGEARAGFAARTSGRVLRVGRIAPGWGRGLVVGTTPDPWTARATRDDPFAPRPRGGDGAWCAWPGAGVEAFAGQLGARPAAGLACRVLGAWLGTAWARGTTPAASLAWERGATVRGPAARRRRAVTTGAAPRDSTRARAPRPAVRPGDALALELAGDPAGRWRAEIAAARRAGACVLTVRGAAGHRAFRAPLGAARAGPPRVAAASLLAPAGPLRVTATLAGWEWAAGAAGTRAGVEAACAAGAGTWTWGVDEQHGPRRAPAVSARATGMRQGSWLEWRGTIGDAALVVRDEWWGARAFARGRVRESLAAAVEAPLPGGARATFAHTVYRARSGETIYVPERDADHWVLRALGGAGARTRAALELPVAEGTLRAGLAFRTARTPSRAQWSLQWSRRVRLPRAR